jgi:hypothetical protein
MPKFLPLTNSKEDDKQAAAPALSGVHAANGSRHGEPEPEPKVVDAV